MYKKISIVGGPGSGKTTLSNKLSEIYRIPVTHKVLWKDIYKIEIKKSRSKKILINNYR